MVGWVVAMGDPPGFVGVRCLLLRADFEDMLQGSRKEIEQLFRTGIILNREREKREKRERERDREGEEGEKREREKRRGMENCVVCVSFFFLSIEFEGKFPHSRRMLETLAKEGM